MDSTHVQLSLLSYFLPIWKERMVGLMEVHSLHFPFFFSFSLQPNKEHFFSSIPFFPFLPFSFHPNIARKQGFGFKEITKTIMHYIYTAEKYYIKRYWKYVVLLKIVLLSNAIELTFSRPDIVGSIHIFTLT